MRYLLALSLSIFLFLPAMALAAVIDDRISEVQKIFQDFEDGKSSYLETLTELWIWKVDGKSVSFTNEDLERLEFKQVSSYPIEFFVNPVKIFGKVVNADKLKDEIFININGQKIKCKTVEASDNGGRKYQCEFFETVLTKTVFNGTRAFAEFGARTSVDMRMEESDYENAKFKVAREANFGGYGFTEEQNGRKLIEESFPGFSKSLCNKPIKNTNTIEMLMADWNLASEMTLTYTDQNYNFRLINEDYSLDNEDKECEISVREDKWKDYKFYKCRGGYNKGGRWVSTFSPNRDSDCQEEIAAKIPETRISFKIILKKAVIERGFERAWEKLKSEYSKNQQIEIESEAQEGLEKLKSGGMGSISFKIYNDSASLFEATISPEAGRTLLKPEFSEKSDVRVKIKSDVLHKIYSKYWSVEGKFPEPKSEEFKRRFLGIFRTIIELVRGSVSGDVKIEPFWEAGKASAALEKLTAFESCTENFFEKAEKNTTTPAEFNKCYDALK